MGVVTQQMAKRQLKGLTLVSCYFIKQLYHSMQQVPPFLITSAIDFFEFK